MEAGNNLRSTKFTTTNGTAGNKFHRSVYLQD